MINNTNYKCWWCSRFSPQVWSYILQYSTQDLHFFNNQIFNSTGVHAGWRLQKLKIKCDNFKENIRATFGFVKKHYLFWKLWKQTCIPSWCMPADWLQSSISGKAHFLEIVKAASHPVASTQPNCKMQMPHVWKWGCKQINMLVVDIFQLSHLSYGVVQTRTIGYCRCLKVYQNVHNISKNDSHTHTFQNGKAFILDMRVLRCKIKIKSRSRTVLHDKSASSQCNLFIAG